MINILIQLLTQYGIIGIVIAAFFEAIIFPPPVEVILLPVMLANPGNAIWLALITVAASQVGGMAGYYLGKRAGRPLLIRLFGENKLRAVEKAYDKYGAYAIITSAFTPIPYEAYTLSAGAFRMNFCHYLAATTTGRILRYIPEGIAVQLFGYAVTAKVVKGMGLLVSSAVLLVLVYIIIKKFIIKNK